MYNFAKKELRTSHNFENVDRCSSIPQTCEKLILPPRPQSPMEQIDRGLGQLAKDSTQNLLAWQKESSNTSNKRSEEIETIERFIRENRKSVCDGLKEIVSKHKFTLIGEVHVNERDPVRKEIASTLKELKEKGLTHVGLEISSDEEERLDALDYTKSDEYLKKEIRAPYMCDVLIAAKRNGLKVVYMDKPMPAGISDRDYGRLSDNGTYQNSRDKHMFDLLTNSMGKKDKALVYIGSKHVHENYTEKNKDGIKINRIGTLLSKKYGGDEVGSIRSVLFESSFDGLIVSKKKSLRDVMPGHKGFMILPDKGPIKGDPRVTGTDYMIVGK